MYRIYRFVSALFITAMLDAATVPGRYIVELNTEPVADHVTRSFGRGGMRLSGAVSAHRARVRSEQDSVRARFEGRPGVAFLDSSDTVGNFLYVQVADSAVASELAATPGVKRVIPARQVRMYLDRAVGLHRVADAWNRVGDANAGAGMKIAIIDSGIEVTHAGFKDASLPMPDSYPRANKTADLAYTSNKIIAARSYVNLLPNRDPDTTPRDHVGHGTALAMVAAGVRNAGPKATITGVAPRAYLGSYKVFGTPGYNDSASDDAILKAIDDAVADGMDVINLSLGSDVSYRFADDPEVQAIESAAKAGVIVVAAAGNNGPDFSTIGSPATAPSAIAVGAMTNDRTFAASVDVPGMSSFLAIAGDGVTPAAPISGVVSDVAALDNNGLACSTLPSGSLQGKVALILRGSCTFETKLINAQRAGAVAGLVYAAADSPDPIPMATGAATLPAEMVANGDGAALKQAVAAGTVTVTMNFSTAAVAVAGARLTDFSAIGPNVDLSIKPDILAVGQDMYTATQTIDAGGDMYDPSGYVLVDGTSFSSPLVAGMAALLKAARPGLSVDQYRSLLINSAGPALTHAGDSALVQQSGAGIADALAALQSNVTAYPTSMSFGAGGGDVDTSRALTLTNVGSASETFAVDIAARNGGAAPVAGSSSITVGPGESATAAIAWKATSLSAGAYEGFVTITAASTGAQIRVPYWYGVASNKPATITTLDTLTSGRRGSVQTDAVLFRVTDGAGISLTDIQPQGTTVSGGGAVRGVVSHDADAPGVFGLNVQLGPTRGTNVFRLQAGDAVIEVSISGQ